MAVVVTYTNEDGNIFEFSKESGVILEDVDGVSSNDISFSESTVSNQIGSSITGMSVSAKNITLEGVYKTNPNVRKNLLSVFLPKKSGTLRIVDTNKNIDVYWKVNPSKTPDITSGLHREKFQITLRCPYPYARSTESNLTDFNTLTSNHKFSRSYSGTIPFKLSTREIKPLKEITNNGVLDSGFIIQMTAEVDDIQGPSVINVNTQEKISFPKLTLNIGNVLEISTYENERYCHLIKDRSIENAFKYMSYDSTFFQLSPGKNVIRYASSTNEDSLETRLSFDDTLAGI